MRRVRKVVFLWVLAILASAGLPAKVAAAGSPVAATAEGHALAVQEARYRCLIAAYLAAIRRAPRGDGYNRFLALAAATKPTGYVQCLFHEHDSRLYCEAASGFYDDDTARFMTADKIVEIAALGYKTDASKGNFSQDRAAPDAPALYQVAGLLLETLVKVYDLQAGDELEFSAPLVTGNPMLQAGGGEDCGENLISLLPAAGRGRGHT